MWVFSVIFSVFCVIRLKKAQVNAMPWQMAKKNVKLREILQTTSNVHVINIRCSDEAMYI